MYSEYFLGIDIGTSYIKASVFKLSEGFIKSKIKPSPKLYDDIQNNLHYADNIYLILEELILDICEMDKINCHRNFVAFISSISPVMVSFERDKPKNSATIPYWRIEDVDNLATGGEKSHRRILHLLQHQSEPKSNILISDLIGYLIFRFSGVLTLNSYTLSEFGGDSFLQKLRETIHLSQMPSVHAPTKIVGQSNTSIKDKVANIHFCCGAPDSFATAFGSRSLKKQDLMIYLGTFGSVLKINHDIVPNQILNQRNLPYKWVLSVPEFGQTIERIASNDFCNLTSFTSLEDFDLKALTAPAGAGGSLLKLPMWNFLGLKTGSFKFFLTEKDSHVLARATLEALGLLMLVTNVIPKTQSSMNVAGGGSKSEAWLQILCDVLAIRLNVSSFNTGGRAACLLAIYALQPKLAMEMLHSEVKSYFPDPKAQKLLSVTINKATELYHT